MRRRAVLFDVGGPIDMELAWEMALDGAIAAACGMEGIRVDPDMVEEASDAAVAAFAPDVYCWLLRLDDASGVEGAWLDAAAPLPETLSALLAHCAATYLPFLAANTRALQQGLEEVEVEIGGRRYAQAPFRYQGKCHDALRKKLAALGPEVRRRLDPILEETGCIHALA